MTVPAYLLDGERYPHGTRARYNSAKCRCDACRAANTAYEKSRRERQANAAATVTGSPVSFTKPHGKIVRTYRRQCIGVRGQPCPEQRYLRSDSTGDVCNKCRRLLDPNGLVPTGPVVRRMRSLQRKGLGWRAIADAADVPRSTLREVRAGRRKFIRAQAAQRILALDAGAIADHALVDATLTRKLLREILAEGFRKYDISRRLGSTGTIPALTFKHDRVLAITELKVKRLHAQLLADEGEPANDVEQLDESPRGRILRAIRFFERVSAQELFDAMDVSAHDRVRYTKALNRLAQDGEVARYGERFFEYGPAAEQARAA